MSEAAETPEVIRDWYNASSNDGSSCVDVRMLDGGIVQTRNSNSPDTTVVSYDADEWAAFIRGAKDGTFDLIP